MVLVPVRDTITVPMLQEPESASQKKAQMFLFGAIGLFIVSLLGLGAGGFLYWRSRRTSGTDQKTEA